MAGSQYSSYHKQQYTLSPKIQDNTEMSIVLDSGLSRILELAPTLTVTVDLSPLRDSWTKTPPLVFMWLQWRLFYISARNPT